MAEKGLAYVRMQPPAGKEEIGSIEAAAEVLEIIAGIAANEIEGVASMRGNFASGVAERLGKKVHSKGVKTELHEDSLAVDIHLVVNYGVSIPETARKVQKQVRQALYNMTALEAQEVNVHITGIQFEHTPAE
ncbi:Asp23/Gls24 family envelope stress response protein [Indiicoccus explosivorum]|uniref:Asp23/Gls24 family envelope stress response protein n=1 Tax=Indiicoccus explosivorum TaxID=1917864 RepID=UPI000B42F297|nr:Asp23/Gls24 family envelope stress response protein [Indiicoccus explosivorum]